MSNAGTVIAALRGGYDSLASLVSGLSDDDLARPSGASEWDISQVLPSRAGGGRYFRDDVLGDRQRRRRRG